MVPPPDDELTGWPRREVPEVALAIALNGGRGDPRPLSGLWFAAFAELIKSNTYPKATQAFHINIWNEVTDQLQGLRAELRAADQRLVTALGKLEDVAAALDAWGQGLARIETTLDRVAEDTAILRRQNEDLQATVNKLVAATTAIWSDARGLTEAQARRIAESFAAQGLPAEQFTETLLKAGETLRALQESLRALSNDDPAVARLRNEAAKLLDGADFAGAEATLREAQRIDAESIEELAERMERRRLSAATTLGERARLASAQLRWLDAAALYAEAFAILPETERRRRWEMALLRANALQEHGRIFPGPSLAEAVTVFADIALPLTDRAEAPADWAGTQNNLGNALSQLGARMGGAEGVARLEAAVAAFGLALTVRTREPMPADWAMTQSNLGNALLTLGQRAGGAEGIERLEAAVAAYGLALTVYTREAMPADWAMTQNNLGGALARLGERTGGAEGVARLKAAVAAYEAALKVYARDAMPADWAMTMENIALARVCQSRLQPEQRVPFLQLALAAVHGALEVYKKGGMGYDLGTATALRTQILAELNGAGSFG